MSDKIAQWLEEHDLGKYIDVFTENAIDMEVLPNLSDDDLRELGLLLGHRRKFQLAVQSLRDQVKTGAEVADSYSAEKVLSYTEEAERRQLTVMFCDLADSTNLSYLLDPEDLRELNRGYQNVCREAIEQFGGYVARYMGDGVLAYFGYPQAHEDDAERAVYAGLAIVEAMPILNETVAKKRQVVLAVRVGVATGQVVVGDLIGEGSSQENAVVGEAPNLAARLQSLASVNAVVVGPSTYDLTVGRFDFEDLGRKDLKGITQPTRVRRVIGPASVESRFATGRGAALTKLVGRAKDIALLQQSWECAKISKGQVVLISGEPGIGKSRLCEALHRQTLEKPKTRLYFQCSPYHVGSAFHPVISHIEHAAGIDAHTLVTEKLNKLEELVRQSSVDIEHELPILAELLSLPKTNQVNLNHNGRHGTKDQTLNVLVKRLENLASQKPVLCVFEDVHWADPATFELLDKLVERVKSLRILLLLTFRPEFAAPWTDRAFVNSIVLNRLSRRQSRNIIVEKAGSHTLPEATKEEIISKTDGIPLFIEECTQAVLESQELDRIKRVHDDQFPVPATLRDSLMARLDRLGTGKVVAQVGSTIGGEFTHTLLKAVWKLDDLQLKQGLKELLESGLVYQTGTGSTTAYVFRHALLRDAAYESLLNSTRRAAHRSIAEELTERSPSQIALLAHHWEQAGELNLALYYRTIAAAESAKLHGLLESITHYWTALRLLDQLPETQDTLQCHLDTVLALIPVRQVFWDNEVERGEALRYIDKAIEVADNGEKFAALAQLKALKGTTLRDEGLLSQAVKDAQTSGDVIVQAEVASEYANYLGMLGRFNESSSHKARAIQLYKSLGWRHNL